MTKAEIIQETVDYYQGHPERFSANTDDNGDITCLYTNSKGEHCAFGRCMTKEAQKKVLESSLNNAGLMELPTLFSRLDGCLRPEYHGHPLSFWSLIQGLHDDFFKKEVEPSYWTKDAQLTEQGQKYIQSILQRFP